VEQVCLLNLVVNINDADDFVEVQRPRQGDPGKGVTGDHHQR
jgi:hypothetical protein